VRVLKSLCGLLPIRCKGIFTKRAARTERGKTLSLNRLSVAPLRCIEPWGPYYWSAVTQGRYQARIPFPLSVLAVLFVKLSFERGRTSGCCAQAKRVSKRVSCSLDTRPGRVLKSLCGILPIRCKGIFTKRAARTERGKETLSPNRLSVVPLRCVELWGPDYSSEVTHERYQAPSPFPSLSSLSSLSSL
jgi:hypothetical protein